VQAAWAQDPGGTGRRLLTVRVRDCDRPGLLAGVVSADVERSRPGGVDGRQSVPGMQLQAALHGSQRARSRIGITTVSG
jgi:hypothetical protein